MPISSAQEVQNTNLIPTMLFIAHYVAATSESEVLVIYSSKKSEYKEIQLLSSPYNQP